MIAESPPLELQDLVGRELAVQHGVKRWASYSLANLEGFDETRVARRKPANRRDEILNALGNETLSRAEIARRTGLKDRVVRHWLKVLREEGKVERTTQETQSIKAEYRTVHPLGQRTLFEELELVDPQANES